jgi:hypothetical protein
MLAHFGDRIRIAGVDGSEEFVGLTLKLFRSDERASGRRA